MIVTNDEQTSWRRAGHATDEDKQQNNDYADRLHCMLRRTRQCVPSTCFTVG